MHIGNTNICAKFGQIIMDDAMYVAISMCICLGIHTSSYYIGHFVKVFFQTCCSASLIIFPQTSAQKMAPCKGISFFEPFFIFSFFSKWGQTWSVDHWYKNVWNSYFPCPKFIHHQHWSIKWFFGIFRTKLHHTCSSNLGNFW